MSGTGPDPATASHGGRRPWYENLAAFIAGVVAVTLPEQSDGFPSDLRGATFLVLGGLAGGVLAVGVTRVVPWVLRPLSATDQSGSVPARPRSRSPVSERLRPLLRRLSRMRRWWRLLALAVVGGIVVFLVVPPGVAQIRLALYGCEHPVELRVLTSPGSLRLVQRAADLYERTTAYRNRGCPAANLFVYSASALDIRDALRRGWPDEELVRHPRPDIWIADSMVEVDDVLAYQGSAATTENAAVRGLPPLRLVLAVPEPAADTLRRGLPERFTWSQLWQEVYQEHNWDLLRAQPEVVPAGRIATAALYASLVPALRDGDTDLNQAEKQQLTELERHLAGSVGRGRYQTTDVDSTLCRYRSLAGISPVTTVVLTEEEVRDYNGLRLGSGIRCGNAETALVPFYPEDTLLIRRSFVRFDWGDRLGRQVRQADRFGDWLVEGGGRELLEVATGDPEPVGATEVGTEPGSALVERVEAERRQVNPKGRILVLLDTSGSMEQSAGRSPDGGPERTRIEVAKDAVSQTLDLMIGDDAYGLWTFPGGETTVRERVPVTVVADGAAIDELRSATEQALAELPVAGPTPLLAAVAEAVDELAGFDDDRRAALVVVTDGSDTGGGPDLEDLARDVAQPGAPKVFVLAVGEADCTDDLARVTEASGGDCLRSHFDDLDDDLRSIARVIWSGDDDSEQ